MFQQAAVKKKCRGGHINKGTRATVEECAEECKDLAHMFIYQNDPKSSCKLYGCMCYCQTAASPDGTCEQEDIEAYNLYRFIHEGDIMFCLKINTYIDYVILL